MWIALSSHTSRLCIWQNNHLLLHLFFAKIGSILGCFDPIYVLANFGHVSQIYFMDFQSWININLFHASIYTKEWLKFKKLTLVLCAQKPPCPFLIWSYFDKFIAKFFEGFLFLHHCKQNPIINFKFNWLIYYNYHVFSLNFE